MFNYALFDSALSVAIADKYWYHYITNLESASNAIRPHAKEELTHTAEIFEGYLQREPDSLVREAIYRGMLECFQQAVEFTIYRDGFEDTFHCTRKQYIRELLTIPVFERVFKFARPDEKKWRLLRFLGTHDLVGLLLACLDYDNYRKNKERVRRTQ